MGEWIKTNIGWMIACLATVFIAIIFTSSSAERKAMKILQGAMAKLQASELKVGNLERAIAANAYERSQLSKERAELRGIIEEMERNPKIVMKPVEKVRVITVDKIEYVPKIEYQTLYQACQFSLVIRDKYRQYINLDKSVEENYVTTVEDFKALVGEKDYQIGVLKTSLNKMANLALRKISVNVGPGFGLQTDGKLRVVPIVLSIGWRIW